MIVQPSTICIYCEFYQKENEYTKEVIDFCNSHKKYINNVEACYRFKPKGETSW